MKIKSDILIEELVQETQQIIKFVTALQEMPIHFLSKRPDENSWNTLECIEHLNYYAEFYHEEISKRMSSDTTSKDINFKSGFLGNYFAKSMLPKEKINKMKTLKKTNPLRKNLDISVIEFFLIQQDELLNLLEIAKNKNLNKIKTSISITNLIKFRLGDTFRFVIYHNMRHIAQIKRILTTY